MEIRKIKLGETHPLHINKYGQSGIDVSQPGPAERDYSAHCAGTANLALIFANQGRWEETEQLQVQTMKRSKAVFGENHPNTLASMGNLASTFWTQGRWDDAENLEVQVMMTCKTKLGEYYPETLSSMSNLAHTWKSLSRDAEAMNLLRDCLKKQKRNWA
ncbi:uncharacterized protein N7469_007623 [Penicillium citrinum]|uniref:Kinesin light chain n=1 Tax=Penicillium citrinum TaxID=5077 RepID=A0A9W9NX47_PENCI|nr:uncharacterized protein N7469_007623 [Penicillium citrinum]KAJ5227617.1 hypothetical protein N7469_007623 [Penicillium citrinum]